MCILEHLYNTLASQEIQEAIHSYFITHIEHFKSLEHIEAYIWFLAECIIFLIPISLVIIITYIGYKLFKYLIKDFIKYNKCRNIHTDCKF